MPSRTQMSSRDVCYSSIPQTTSTNATRISSPSSGYVDSSVTNVPTTTVLVASNPPSIPSTPLPQFEAHQDIRGVPEWIAKLKKAIKPFAPEDVQRYQRRVRISRRSRKSHLDPFTLDFSRPDKHEWERCMHPEGALYFYMEQNGRRTMTDSNMDDERTRQLAHYFTRKLWRNAAKNEFIVAKQVELVLSVSLNDKDGIAMYYFVSHDDLLLFWLDRFLTDGIFYNVRGVEKIDHIKLAVETQYWAHCELYPNHVLVRESVVEELRGTLLHAASEGILSDGSLTPLSVSELQQLLGLLTAPVSYDRKNKYLTCVIARLMRLFMRLKFINFFGQSGARLNADQSLYSRIEQDDRSKLSVLIQVVDLFLFSAPSAHVKQLRRMWVDHTINVLRWRSFINTLSSEWNGFTIYSTVMLAVDVSFLSIPEMNGSHTAQTIAQVAIYFSTLSAVGSLLASVLLTNQVRGQGLQTADQAASYMLKMASNAIGMDALGIMFSIPFALIMWGMIFFVCGLSVVIFGSEQGAPMVIAVPFWVLVATLASWPAWYAGGCLLACIKTREKAKKKQKGGHETTSDAVLPIANDGAEP